MTSRAIDVFKVLCKELDSDRCVLFSQSFRRCVGVSHSNVIKHLFELGAELLLFLMEKSHNHQEYLKNEKFISKLAYLFDRFGALNLFNLAFEETHCNEAEYMSKMTAFEGKLNIWKIN